MLSVIVLVLTAFLPSQAPNTVLAATLSEDVCADASRTLKDEFESQNEGAKLSWACLRISPQSTEVISHG